MRVQERMKFSTKDRDNDINSSMWCARILHGAWWYIECRDSNLNGRYYMYGERTPAADGIVWRQWRGLHYSLKSVEMKIRPGLICYKCIVKMYDRLYFAAVVKAKHRCEPRRC